MKRAGFVGGTISSADFDLVSAGDLVSADAAERESDSFEVQPFARIKARTTTNKVLRDCNVALNCVFIFLFV